MNGFKVDPGERTRAGHVDLPCAFVVEIIRRADPRQHVAALIVDRDNADGNIRARAMRAVMRQRLEILLQIGIQRQRNDRPVPERGDRAVGGMRRQDRDRLAHPRHRHGLGRDRVLVRDPAVLDHAVEHAVARDLRRLGVTVEPTVFRRLRQRHQQRRFRQRQPLRLLAEIGDRGRANAFEIAAIGRQRQIQIEDLVLAQLALDLDGAHHLMQLGVNRALMPRLHQPRQLHGDGRAAGDDVAACDKLERRARQRQRIDAAMRVEALVLIGEQQFQVGRIDIGLGIDRQPPAAVGHRIGTQQLAVAVDHRLRDLPRLAQRQRPERDHPGGQCADRDQAGNGQDRRHAI